MFYVLDTSPKSSETAISVAPNLVENFSEEAVERRADTDYGDDDIDFVDDALLNTAPHNAIERQLLNGDVIGLALMSGAIIWSAMGAFG